MAIAYAIRVDGFGPPVEVTEVLKPRIDPDELRGKFIVLDVLARDASGRFYNIEMQARRHAGWNARSTYYLARTLANQLKNGDGDTRLKPVIGCSSKLVRCRSGSPGSNTGRRKAP